MRKITETAREKMFWILDALKGGRFAKHYREIKSCFLSDADSLLTCQQKKLSQMLDHAIRTVPYYQKTGNRRTLESFPVVNKTTIRDNLNDFVSNQFSEDQLIATVTSGSTGTPFKVYQHQDKKIRNAADALYFARKTGYSIGDCVLYLKIWSANNRKGRVSDFLQNLIPVDVITLDENEVCKLIKRIENHRSTFAMLGYSSAIEQVCKYLDKSGHGTVKAKISSAISMSETLNDYTKSAFERQFGVPVYSRYSNVENGILAQQVMGSDNRYLINTASYIVEILKLDSDHPVTTGALGRIVVTDLFNLAMPMIRYDTGDIGALSEITDQNGNRYLDRIEGRKLDQLFATDGSLVSSYIVYKNMWQYTEITQYQLVQHGPKDYLFKINMEGRFQREQQLIAEFKKFLGADANFKIHYVEEIPLLASGKRKKVANSYHGSAPA